MVGRSHVVALLAALAWVTVAHAQQYPLMEMIADRVVQKYQQSSCEQLWKERGQPKPEREEEGVQLLRADPVPEGNPQAMGPWEACLARCDATAAKCQAAVQAR